MNQTLTPVGTAVIQPTTIPSTTLKTPMKYSARGLFRGRVTAKHPSQMTREVVEMSDPKPTYAKVPYLRESVLLTLLAIALLVVVKVA